MRITNKKEFISIHRYLIIDIEEKAKFKGGIYMEIKIIGKEIKTTEAINDYVERKLDRIDKYFEDAKAEIVIKSEKNVLTFNHEPIYSNKAVVLYQNENDEYKYLFNSDHGLLGMAEAFKAIFNSGQIWKFRDMELLKIANDNFYKNIIEDTNLGIIQKYFDLLENSDDIEIIGLNRWVNCNTREDYKLIKDYWEK